MTRRVHHYDVSPPRIAASLALGHKDQRLEQFWHSDQSWHEVLPTGQTAATHRLLKRTPPAANAYDIQNGLRIVHLEPEPETERVPLHRVIGRRLAAHPDIVIETVCQLTKDTTYVQVEGYPRPHRDGRPFSRQFPDQAYVFPTKLALSLGRDGEVEVLAGEPEHYYFKPTHPSEQHVLDALKDDWNRTLRGEGTYPRPASTADLDRAIEDHETRMHPEPCPPKWSPEYLRQEAKNSVEAEVLRRARALSAAKRVGAHPRFLRSRREELERAAARLR